MLRPPRRAPGWLSPRPPPAGSSRPWWSASLRRPCRAASSRRWRAGRGEFPLAAQQPAQLPDEGGLAVHERVHPAGRELQRPHRLDQRLAHRAVAAMQPGQFHGPRAEQLLLLRRVGDLHEDVGRGTQRETLQRGGDRRQGALVTDQQVPVRVRARGVRAAGADEVHRVAGAQRGGPRAGQPLVAVVHHVDGQLAGQRIPAPHRVGAQPGPLLPGQVPADRGEVQRLGVRDPRLREHHLDVVVGELAHRQADKLVPTEDDPDQVRGGPLGAQHPGRGDVPGAFRHVS